MTEQREVHLIIWEHLGDCMIPHAFHYSSKADAAAAMDTFVEGHLTYISGFIGAEREASLCPTSGPPELRTPGSHSQTKC